MSRVFFDTNVWLPAVLSGGFIRRLVRAAEMDGTVVISPQLCDEVVEKPALKFRVEWQEIERAKVLMSQTGRMFADAVTPHPECPDPDDAILLAQALRAGCRYFVTNDGLLLDLGSVEDMEILTPRRLAEALGVV